MDNKTFKKMLLGMAMASPLALINSGNVHASSVKTNVGTNWHANSLATVQQELRNQNINPDYKITNAKYIVQAGDTLSQIAAATHINMYHIAAVNHIQNLNLIYVGQVLILNQGNEVAHNVAGNGNTTAASVGNTYTLRSASQQPVLNRYGHTQTQGATGVNVQTANVNSQGTSAAEKPAKTIIPSTPSANNNNNQNAKPVTPTSNTGVNTGSTATPNTQGVASQTGSSAAQNNNSQKASTVASSSASQQSPAQSSSAQQPASSASHATTPSASSNTQRPASSASSASQPTSSSQAQGSASGSQTTSSSTQQSSSASHATTPSASSNTQRPASSASSANQPTSSSQAQGSASSSQTTTSSSTQQPASLASQSTTASSASSNTQQPAQSSSSQSSTSSSSQQTTTSSSSSQPASSNSSSSQSTASTSSPQSSASSSSQSSASSSSQSSTSSSASSSSQKTVDGYTLDNMPLSVFNDKKNLDAINNTFSGDAIENYFNNHIGKGNMTWEQAQEAQQNGTITSAILSWNGQMLPTEMNPNDNSANSQLVNNEMMYSWRNALPANYLNNDSQKAQINKKYGDTNSNFVENATQQQALNEYCLSLINKYRESQGLPRATVDSTISQVTLDRANSYSASDLDHTGHPEGYSECLGGGISNGSGSMFDMMDSSYNAIYNMIFNDQDNNNEHRNILLHSSKLAFATRKLSDGSVILIVEGQ